MSRTRITSTASIESVDFDRELVAAARRRLPSDRVADGLRLFDRAWHIMADGVRHQHPDATEEQVLAIVRKRLALARRLEWT